MKIARQLTQRHRHKGVMGSDRCSFRITDLNTGPVYNRNTTYSAHAGQAGAAGKRPLASGTAFCAICHSHLRVYCTARPAAG